MLEASIWMKRPRVGLGPALTMPLRMLALATPAVNVFRLSGHQTTSTKRASQNAAAYGTRHCHGQHKQKPGMSCATILHTIPYTCWTLQDGTCSTKKRGTGYNAAATATPTCQRACGSHTKPVSLIRGTHNKACSMLLQKSFQLQHMQKEDTC